MKGIKKLKKPKTQEQIVDDRKLSQKLNDFFKRNNYLTVIFLVFLVFYMIFTTNSYKNEVNERLDHSIAYIQKNLNHIGFLSATGMLITAKLEAVSYDDPRLKEVIVNQISEPFLQSGDDITFGYTKKFKSMKDMVKKNNHFLRLYKSFSTKNGKRALKKLYSVIFRMVSSNLYPEYITVKKRDILAFQTRKLSEDEKTDKQKGRDIFEFRSVIQYELKTKSWIVQLNKWIDEDIYFKIEVSGFIDPVAYASSNNLLGFVIDKITLPVITKPSL